VRGVRRRTFSMGDWEGLVGGGRKSVGEGMVG